MACRRTWCAPPLPSPSFLNRGTERLRRKQTVNVRVCEKTGTPTKGAFSGGTKMYPQPSGIAYRASWRDVFSGEFYDSRSGRFFHRPVSDRDGTVVGTIG